MRNTPPGPRTTWSRRAAPMRGRRNRCQPSGPRPARTSSTETSLGPSPVITTSRRVTLTTAASARRSSHIETDATRIGRRSRGPRARSRDRFHPTAGDGRSAFRSRRSSRERAKATSPRTSRPQGALEGAPGGLAADGEDDALEPAAGLEVAADLVGLDLGRLGEREAADAGAEGDERQRARAELLGLPSVAAVARRMMSADVGPPSSIVAAWMTQRAGTSRPSSRPPRRARSARAGRSPAGLRAAGARDRARHPAAVPAAACWPRWRSRRPRGS